MAADSTKSTNTNDLEDLLIKHNNETDQLNVSDVFTQHQQQPKMSINYDNVPNDAAFITSVARTGLYPYRCCFTIKVKESTDFEDKTAFGKLKYLKSVIMTLYSLAMTLYLTVIVSLKDNKYDFLHLNPDYSFSEYYKVISTLRYLNYWGLFQMLMSWNSSDRDDEEQGIIKFMHPKLRFKHAIKYGNIKDSPLNWIRFITKSLTITNLVVNILLLSGSWQHYSIQPLVLLIIQTVNDYFVLSDFNTYDAKYKPDGICQSVKVKVIELFTNWYMIIFSVLFEVVMVIIAVLMIVMFLLCCFTCCCCGKFGLDEMDAILGVE